MNENEARFAKMKSRAATVWKWAKRLGVGTVFVFALIGAVTVYAEAQSIEPSDQYVQLRNISGLTIDVSLDGQAPDGVPDILVVVTGVSGVLRDVDKETFTLQVEGVTVPPFP